MALIDSAPPVRSAATPSAGRNASDRRGRCSLRRTDHVRSWLIPRRTHLPTCSRGRASVYGRAATSSHLGPISSGSFFFHGRKTDKRAEGSAATVGWMHCDVHSAPHRNQGRGASPKPGTAHLMVLPAHQVRPVVKESDKILSGSEIPCT